jgi:hypothetical protein
MNLVQKIIKRRSHVAEENKPNNPQLWSKILDQARKKFEVFPSAYASAWASKKYKEEGGTWSKK